MENFEHKPDVSQALLRIAEIKNMIGVMGANSNEFSDLAKIEVDLQKSVLKPEDAISRANLILDSKQDYH